MIDAAAARELVSTVRIARLATVRSDGRPHVVPVCFALVGDDTIVSAVDHKPKRTASLVRLDNVRANARVSLLVDHYDDDWSQLWWVRADGTGRIVESGAEHATAVDALAERYHQYRAVRPADAVLAIDVAEWSGWRGAH